MTRLFREVDIVEGEPVERVEYFGVRRLCWWEICDDVLKDPARGSLKAPQLGFALVDYTAEDVEKLHQRIRELESLIDSLRVLRATLVD